MVTFVGNQENFADALKELIELDRAAVEAYQAAEDRLNHPDYKNKFKEFRADHERHIQQIIGLLENHNEKGPEGSYLGKELIAKGKVILANMIGDTTILRAMKSNEIDTNVAYERMNDREDIWPEAREILKQGQRDEKKHKDWLIQTIEAASAT